jgi:hypothetical protein
MLSIIARSSIHRIGRETSVQTSKRFFSTSTKAQDQYTSMTEELEKKARELILGKKTYQEFTQEEKELVNWVQDMFLQEDGGIILPNTQLDWEQKQLELLNQKKP